MLKSIHNFYSSNHLEQRVAVNNFLNCALFCVFSKMSASDRIIVKVDWYLYNVPTSHRVSFGIIILKFCNHTEGVFVT